MTSTLQERQEPTQPTATRIAVVNTGDRVVSAELLARDDLSVVVVTEPRFRDQYESGTEFALVDSLNDPAAAAWCAIATPAVREAQHVVSLSERAALTAGFLRSALALPGQGIESVLACTAKDTMKRAFSAAGIPTVDHRACYDDGEIRAAAKEIGMPVVVKPTLGAGSDAMMVLEYVDDLDSEAFAAYSERLRHPKSTSEKTFPVLVERFHDLDAEYHCDGYVVDGRVQYVRASQYLRPVLDYATGLFGSFTLPDERSIELHDLHAAAVAATSLRSGTTHFEAFESNGRLYASELASRPGGGGIRRMLHLRDGFDQRAAHLAASMSAPYTWDGSRRESEVLQLMLPARRGRVVEITSSDTLAALPGVIEAEVRLQPGDVVDGLMDSSTVSGLVQVDLGAVAVQDAVDAVREAFHVHVDAG